MNIIVKTPEKWKAKLFEKTTATNEKIKQRKRVSIPIAIAAVVLAFAISFTSVAAATVPKYFSSYFNGDADLLNGLYSPTETVFDDDTEDFTLTCKGIIGDSTSFLALFDLKSNGDFSFKDTNQYGVEDMEYELKPFYAGSCSYGFGGKVIDEKTAEFHLEFSGDGTRFLGKKANIKFKNLKIYDENNNLIDSKECVFSGSIKIDYPNSSRTLKPEKLLKVNGKIEVSNIGIMVKLKKNDEIKNIEKITLKFSDGTQYSQDVSKEEPVPPDYGKNEKLILGSSAISDEQISREFRFSDLMDSSEISAIIINDSIVFN